MGRNVTESLINCAAIVRLAFRISRRFLLITRRRLTAGFGSILVSSLCMITRNFEKLFPSLFFCFVSRQCRSYMCSLCRQVYYAYLFFLYFFFLFRTWASENHARSCPSVMTTRVKKAPNIRALWDIFGNPRLQKGSPERDLDLSFVAFLLVAQGSLFERLSIIALNVVVIGLWTDDFSRNFFYKINHHTIYNC